MEFSFILVSLDFQSIVPLRLLEEISEFFPYFLIGQHMIDIILINEHREEYQTKIKYMCEDIDSTHWRCLYFDDERLYVDDDEDDLLDDSWDIFMVDIKGSLQHKQ